MVRIEPRHKVPKIFTSLPALILLCLLTLFLSFGLVTMISKGHATRDEKEGALHELETLEKERDNLTSEIDLLETPEGKEEIYRNAFRVSKDGEKLVVIVDDTTAPPEEEKGSIGRFFDRLFH